MEINKFCRGCSACVYECSKNAIDMTVDKNGFSKAIVDEKKCVNCGNCKIVCNKVNRDEGPISSFCAFSLNDKIRLNSSSGGIFGEIAKEVLLQNGVVYGASFNKQFELKHKRIDNIEHLSELMGSKYLQSMLGNIFVKVKDDLMKNKIVLFSGTPCQINGLYTFLNKKYANLYTLDIICHGVPSPRIWKDYLKTITFNNQDLKEIRFRNKKTGWHRFSFSYKIRNKEKASLFIDNSFCFMFDKHYSLPNQCFNCQYAGKTHPADITLGDFWGIEKFEFKDDNKGMSLVTTNSAKGFKLLNQCESIVTNKVDYRKSMENNLMAPPERPDNYAEFWTDYNDKGYIYCEDKYFYINLKRRIKLFIKMIVYKLKLIKYFIK